MTPQPANRKHLDCLSGIGKPHKFWTVAGRRICPKCRDTFERRTRDVSPICWHPLHSEQRSDS